MAGRLELGLVAATIACHCPPGPDTKINAVPPHPHSLSRPSVGGLGRGPSQTLRLIVAVREHAEKPQRNFAFCFPLTFLWPKFCLCHLDLLRNYNNADGISSRIGFVYLFATVTYLFVFQWFKRQVDPYSSLLYCVLRTILVEYETLYLRRGCISVSQKLNVILQTKEISPDSIIFWFAVQCQRSRIIYTLCIYLTLSNAADMPASRWGRVWTDGCHRSRFRDLYVGLMPWTSNTIVLTVVRWYMHYCDRPPCIFRVSQVSQP